MKISASVKNAILGNLTADRGTLNDQYRVWKSFAANKKVSFDDWRKYNQMIVFNAKQLGPEVGYGSCFTSITLSLQFQVERCFADARMSRYEASMGLQDGATIAAGSQFGKQKANTAARLAFDPLITNLGNRQYVARLVMLEPEIFSLAESSCAVEQVRLTNQQVQQSLTGGSSLVVTDVADLDRYAQ